MGNQFKKEACAEIRLICDEIQNELGELNENIINDEESAIYKIRYFCIRAKGKQFLCLNFTAHN